MFNLRLISLPVFSEGSPLPVIISLIRAVLMPSISASNSAKFLTDGL